MKLTASPFHPTTGDLLPVYRDAYLRGDLSRQHTAAVDAYLKSNSALADDTLSRFYAMKQHGEQVRPVGWVHRQIELIRTEPRRFRQRATAMVAGAALLAGATMAATNLPTTHLPTETDSALETTAVASAAEASSSMALVRTVTVRGRILDENGRPLVGATVLNKATGRGVGTDANGNYTLRVPEAYANQLHYGYGGYADEEVRLNGNYTQNVTLVPRAHLQQEQQQPAAKKHRRWLLF